MIILMCFDFMLNWYMVVCI